MISEARAAKSPFTFALADDAVRITTGFTGADLIIFGTVEEEGTVIMQLEGPYRTAMVRRKESVFGAWMNRAWLRFDDLPVYYDFASSAEGNEFLPDMETRQELHIGLDTLKHPPRKKRYDEKTVELFQNALIRNKQKLGLYPLEAKEVAFLDEGFFKVKFEVPANVPSGEYKVKGFLVRDGEIIHQHSVGVHIGLEGFSSQLYVFSRNYGFFYGLVCVFLAVLAGWLSNALVRRS
ncbi:MAG: TIGR02186 family protein [Alphaproteobacteria bacterium]|nr:TIGR02186 family protein [Alphaproteobacteria bacterium]